MNRFLKIGFNLLIIVVLFSSCATIVGGSKYNAKVLVTGYPYAKIEHNGVYKGTGAANFKAARREANNFEITIKHDGCETQTTKFTQRTFRGWAFVGTVITWTGLSINGGPWLPIPFGVIVDGSTGSWWKPNTNEPGVSKIDHKNFVYAIDYTGCPTDESNKIPVSGTATKADKLRELKQLFEEGLITNEEYEKEKSEILDL